MRIHENTAERERNSIASAKVSAVSDISISYDEITKTLTEARRFNVDSSGLKREYYFRQFEDFSNIAASTEGYKGSFGTGYPFYAAGDDTGLAKIAEIDRYIAQQEANARLTAQRSIGIWTCSQCQKENMLPDLKTYCKPCIDTLIKPRDVFKALPDLDFWAVVEKVDTQKLLTLENSLHGSNFFQSDLDIARSVHDTQKAMSTIAHDDIPVERLPLDAHVITPEELREALAGVRHEVESYSNVSDRDIFVPISPISLHVAWERIDEPYDFMKDYLFSFTPQNMASDLADDIFTTDEIVRRTLSSSDIYDIISRYAKEKRQLDSPAVRRILDSRWGM